jgi:hypothetical protein
MICNFVIRMSPNSAYTYSGKTRPGRFQKADTCRLVLFLAFALLIRQFASFASIHDEMERTDRPVFIESTMASTAYYSAQHPLHSIPENWEMEIVAEDSEENDAQNNWEEPNNQSDRKFSTEELLYTAYLKSLYVHLASSIQGQSQVPRFILHHSWKSFLA